LLLQYVHAVLLVGYDLEQQFWIAKNSWGQGFADGGFFKIKMGVASIANSQNTYGLEWFFNGEPPLKVLAVPAPQQGCFLYTATPAEPYLSKVADTFGLDLKKLALDNVDRIEDLGQNIVGKTLLLCDVDTELVKMEVPGGGSAAGTAAPAPTPTRPSPKPSPVGTSMGGGVRSSGGSGGGSTVGSGDGGNVGGPVTTQRDGGSTGWTARSSSSSSSISSDDEEGWTSVPSSSGSRSGTTSSSSNNADGWTPVPSSGGRRSGTTSSTGGSSSSNDNDGWTPVPSSGGRRSGTTGGGGGGSSSLGSLLPFGGGGGSSGGGGFGLPIGFGRRKLLLQ
jgi:hypothetical protein